MNVEIFPITSGFLSRAKLSFLQFKYSVTKMRLITTFAIPLPPPHRLDP